MQELPGPEVEPEPEFDQDTEPELVLVPEPEPEAEPVRLIYRKGFRVMAGIRPEMQLYKQMFNGKLR